MLREVVDVIVKYNKMIIDEKIDLWRKNCDVNKNVFKDWLDIFFIFKDDKGKLLFMLEEIIYFFIVCVKNLFIIVNLNCIYC